MAPLRALRRDGAALPLHVMEKIPYVPCNRQKPRNPSPFSRVFHMVKRPVNQKMTVLSFWGVYSQKGPPYNPPIAEERGAKRRRARKQASEITKKLAITRFQNSDRSEATQTGKKTEKGVDSLTRRAYNPPHWTTLNPGGSHCLVFLAETIWLPGNRRWIVLCENSEGDCL
ncbi:MAG: hypothetical protein ACI9GK_001291 [Devosia sp.]